MEVFAKAVLIRVIRVCFIDRLFCAFLHLWRFWRFFGIILLEGYKLDYIVFWVFRFFTHRYLIARAETSVQAKITNGIPYSVYSF